MRYLFIICLVAIGSIHFIFLGCSKSTDDEIDSLYVEEIMKWRESQLKQLTSENGWLTLCGLFWLNEGENTVGSHVRMSEKPIIR